MDPEAVTVDISVLDILRTEQFSDVGSLQPIVTETNDFIARRIPFDGDVYVALEVSVFRGGDNINTERAIITERTVLSEDGLEDVSVIIIPEDGYQPDIGTIKEVTY